MNLRKLMNFDAGLNPLSSLSTFQKVEQVKMDPRPTKHLTLTQGGHYPVVWGTANDNLSEKWLLSSFQRFTTANFRNP